MEANKLTQFYTNSGAQPGNTFNVGFVWGQPVVNNLGQQVLNPPIPAAMMQMCAGLQPANDGKALLSLLLDSC